MRTFSPPPTLSFHGLLLTLVPAANVSATVTSAPTTTAQPSDPYCSDWIDVNGFPNHKCSYPGFIRPSENNQACDLWGPLCQTGTIKVDVNLTSTITPTTVPCSVYLSAQSYSFTTSLIQYYYLSTKDTATYLPSFGHSPQCTSFVNLIRQRPETLSFSNCGSNQDTKSFYKQFPAGVDMSNNDVPTQWNCCGLSNCVFDASPIELFYFPGQEEAQCVRTTVSGKVTRVTDANLNGTTTAKAALPSGGALGSIAVVDGFT